MSSPAGALAAADAQVATVRDDPAARLALMARLFRGPTGDTPRHLPFRRAALSFMRWLADLAEPRLLELVRKGSPIYAWPFEPRHVWRKARMPAVARLVARLTRAR